MKSVEALCVGLIKGYPKIFQNYTADTVDVELPPCVGCRVTINLKSKAIKYSYVHIHVLHPTDPTLQAYSHITADALENQETCFLSGRKWKCSKSGVLLLLNIGHGEEYGATCPLMPDHHSRVLPSEIIKNTWKLNRNGYASFYNLFDTQGRIKLQHLSELYHAERLVTPLNTTLKICNEEDSLLLPYSAEVISLYFIIIVLIISIVSYKIPCQFHQNN
jgi:hypothetical protein